MSILNSIKNWLTDPFGVKKSKMKHEKIHQELQTLRGQVGLRTRDLSKHPYRTLNREFRQAKEGADVRIYE